MRRWFLVLFLRWLLVCLLAIIPNCVHAAGNEPYTPLPVDESNQPTADYFTQERAFLLNEDAQRMRRMMPHFLVSGGVHTTTAGMTSPAVATEAFDNTGNHLIQSAVAIPYGSMGCAAADTAWVIISSRSENTLDNFQRVSGTKYYVDCVTPAPVPPSLPPALPSGAAWMMQVTIAGSNITAVLDESIRVVTTPTAFTFSMTTSPRSRWIFHPGGMFVPAAGVILTHRGQMDAGRFKIFDLAAAGSDVLFDPSGVVMPEWWGAAADDSTPSAAAITKALRASPTTTGMDVDLDTGVYRLEAAIETPAAPDASSITLGARLRGAGKRASTILKRTATYIGPLLRINSLSSTGFVLLFSITDVQFHCIDRAVGTIGVQSGIYGESTWEDTHIEQCDTGWHSAGTLVTMFLRNPSFLENNDGFLHDSTLVNNLGLSGVHVSGGRFRANKRNSVYVKNSGDIAIGHRSRSMTFMGTTFEGSGGTTGTPTAVRLENFETATFIGVHFEQHSPHIHISGTGTTFPSRHISFIGCNFGNVHNLSPTNDAFVWTGDSSQGFGSFVENSLIGGVGEWHILHTGTLFEFRNAVLGTATVFGQYFEDRTFFGIPHYITRGDSAANTWILQRVTKVESALASMDFDERIITATTLDATPVVIAVFSDEFAIPQDGAVSIEFELTARQTDNSSLARYGKVAIFRNIAGTITQPVPTENIHTDIETDVPMDAVFVIVSNSVRIQLTGLAAGPAIRWAGRIRTTRFLSE